MVSDLWVLRRPNGTVARVRKASKSRVVVVHAARASMAGNRTTKLHHTASILIVLAIASLHHQPRAFSWVMRQDVVRSNHPRQFFAAPTSSSSSRAALSNKFLEGDLVAVQRKTADDDDANNKPRLCVVTGDGGVYPLCTRADDVETDLFADPRQFPDRFWSNQVTDEHVVGRTYGEGYYSQRVIPSLGGGPGYGALADDVWSVAEDILEKVRADQVELPVLETGIAHGEKARGGSF